jgi:hypothetical protein
MRKISPWSAVIAVAATAALVGGVAFAVEPSTAITDPTQQQALDANETVRNYIVNHPDATASPTPTDTATATVKPTTDPTASATAAPTTTAPVPPTTVPVATTTAATSRVSGLPWSSGVWTNQDPTLTNNFVSTARGGRAVDNVLVYTTRNTIATENAPAQWKAALPATFNGVRQDLVLALATWTSDGAFMTQSQGQAIGASVCSVDATTPIVRLDWEMNLSDGAGSNGAALTAANYTAWVARFRAVATGLKAGCPGLRIDFNPNQGGDQTAGCNSGTYAAPNYCSRRAFQAVKDLVDIFGVDTYDSWPPVTSSGSGWNSHLTAFNRLDESRTYALANGKKWSVPEWGVACTASSACQWQGNAGGDDPEYVKRYVAYFALHAGDIAYETYFDDPDSWILSDLISNNPSSRAQYQASLALAS